MEKEGESFDFFWLKGWALNASQLEIYSDLESPHVGDNCDVIVSSYDSFRNSGTDGFIWHVTH